MRPLAAVFYAALVMMAPCRALAAGAGTTSANLLKVTAGSREFSMGGAGCALSGDLSGILSNPALLSPIGSKSAMFMYWPGIGDMKTEFVSYSSPTSLGFLAGTVLFRSIPDIDNNSAVFTVDEPAVSVNDGMIVLTLGRQARQPAGHAGLSLKIFNSALGEVRATSFALDLGWLGRYREAWYGLSLLNVGLPIKHESTGEMLPITLKGGACYTRIIYPHSLTLSAEVSANVEQDARLAAGVEWLQVGRLGLRAGGAVSRYSGANFTVGAGWQIRSTVLGPEAEYHFDYAYLPFSFLSGYQPTHALSVFVKF